MALVRRLVLAVLAAAAVLATGVPLAAQAGLPLPTDLYVLTNEGRVERYALGAVGAQSVTPADAYVIDFGVDPLGERLAYRTETGLTVVGLTGGAGIALEGASAGLPPYRGMGSTIAWSPSGDALAYTTLQGARVYLESGGQAFFVDLTEGLFTHLSWSPAGAFLAARTDSDVWWVYRREDTRMTLASVIDSSIGAAWVSDSEIAYAPREGGLRLMNLDAANAQTALLDDSVEYRLPTLAGPDALRVFGRARAGDVPEGYGVLLQLTRGAPQVETRGQVAVPLSGLQWAPGGTLMTLLQGGALALFDPVTGEGTPLAVNNVVAVDWGAVRLPPTPPPPPPTLAAPSTPAEPSATAVPPPTATLSPLGLAVESVPGLRLLNDAFFLSASSGSVQGWHLPADGRAPYRFTGSRAAVSEIAPAPDSSGLAYVADTALWFQPLRSGQPILLAALNGFTPATPAFAPDAQRIAYTDETVNGGGIWLAYVDGRPAERILPNTTDADAPGEARRFRRPQFSPDGARLLLDAYAGDQPRIAILDLESGTLTEIAPQGVDPRPLTSRWLPDGRILTWSDAAAAAPGLDPGFYVFDDAAPASAPVEWVPLPADAVVRDVASAGPDRYRALLTSASDALIRIVDVSGFDIRPLAAIDNLQAARLSPDARFIAGYETLSDADGDGILAGPIIIVDLERDGVFRIAEPTDARSFRWVGA